LIKIAEFFFMFFHVRNGEPSNFYFFKQFRII